MLATPKKARPTSARSDSVAAVLARHEATSSATKATRVQAAKAGDMTVKTLQGLQNVDQIGFAQRLVGIGERVGFERGGRRAALQPEQRVMAGGVQQQWPGPVSPQETGTGA